MIEIRRNDDHSIDEVVAEGVGVHIEQLNTDLWMCILDSKDQQLHLEFSSKTKIHCYVFESENVKGA